MSAKQWGWWEDGVRLLVAVEAVGLGQGQGAHAHDGSGRSPAIPYRTVARWWEMVER